MSSLLRSLWPGGDGGQTSVPCQPVLDRAPDSHLHEVRKWVLSLPAPRNTQRSHHEIRFGLPPLKSLRSQVDALPKKELKTYSPSSPSRIQELEEDNFLAEDSVWPPKVSQLGQATRPWAQVAPALVPSPASVAAHAAAEARKRALAAAAAASLSPRALERRRGHLEPLLPASLSPRNRQGLTPRSSAAQMARSHNAWLPWAALAARPPKQEAPRIVVHREGRRSIHGSDPLVGSLFSRNHVLDHVSQKRGVYEGQLRSSR